MNCRTCDYPLWNLKARSCPECGSAFAPSEFEFAPDAVAFHCPHCEQVYYGRGDRGQLVPRTFDCRRCGRRIDMDEMVLLPAEGVAEEHTRGERLAWLDRAERGRVKAWLVTLGQALVAPGRMMRGLPESAPAWHAWLFAGITGIATMIGSILPIMLIAIFFATAAAGAQGGGPGPGTILGAIAATFVATGLVGILMIAVVVLIWGAVAQVILRATGETAGGFGRTTQALLYASGANVAAAVPFLGWYFGWIWWVVSAVLAVRAAQRVSGARAALAVLPAPLVTVALMVVGYGTAMYLALGAAGTAVANQSTATATSETSDRLAVVLAAQADAGAWPGHALELVVGDRLAPGDFISPAWDGMTAETLVEGETSLADLVTLGDGSRRAIADRAAAALGADAVAHRVGDYVFAWHGVDPATAPPGTWIVILAPTPDRSWTAPTIGPAFIAGRLDGGVELVPNEASAPGAITAQSELRAAAGLTPLGDPRLIGTPSAQIPGPAP